MTGNYDSLTGSYLKSISIVFTNLRLIIHDFLNMFQGEEKGTFIGRRTEKTAGKGKEGDGRARV